MMKSEERNLSLFGGEWRGGAQSRSSGSRGGRSSIAALQSLRFFFNYCEHNCEAIKPKSCSQNRCWTFVHYLLVERLSFCLEASGLLDMSSLPRINIEEPRWDQSTYTGRAKHFFTITNPLNLLVSSAELEKAKRIVKNYRAGESEPGLTEDQLWKAKHLYDSAYHPDTGEKMFILGRMSAQVPMNMTITGCMMTFYKSTSAVVFWQWINQSFNALVNYTNRSGDSDIPINVLGTSYVLATGGALVTALGLNSLVKKAPPLIGRLVPFAAVAAANCVNIPMMRRKELQEGIPVFDKNGNKLGDSKVAAQIGIATVTLSRILMASPGMVFPPIVMNALERRGTLARLPWLSAPLQVLLCGFCLTFATPMCCALFPQRSSLSASHIEDHLQEKIKQLPHPVDTVYFNKGL